jgi:hypothetical protein
MRTAGGWTLVDKQRLGDVPRREMEAVADALALPFKKEVALVGLRTPRENSKFDAGRTGVQDKNGFAQA